MNTPKNPEALEQSPEQKKAAKVAALNDFLRMTGQGGQIVVTHGFNALPEERQYAFIERIKNFSDFIPDNDPYQEHDFGAVEIDSETVFWKIDYYDPSMTMHSADKANPEITYRVMTIMMSREY